MNMAVPPSNKEMKPEKQTKTKNQCQESKGNMEEGKNGGKEETKRRTNMKKRRAVGIMQPHDRSWRSDRLKDKDNRKGELKKGKRREAKGRRRRGGKPSSFRRVLELCECLFQRKRRIVQKRTVSL
jgi:hypothetical protein